MRYVHGNQPSWDFWHGSVSRLLFQSPQNGTCPGWVMSLVFVYGNCSYYRHVESAFYCFLLADQKQRGWTTPGKPVLFRGREGPRGSGVFCYSVQVRKPREVLIEPTEATAGLCPEPSTQILCFPSVRKYFTVLQPPMIINDHDVGIDYQASLDHKWSLKETTKVPQCSEWESIRQNRHNHDLNQTRARQSQIIQRQKEYEFRIFLI